MIKGDMIVCAIDGFQFYTLGKQYKIIDISRTGYTIYLQNNIGEVTQTNRTGVNNTNYFVSVKEWRDMQLKKLV